MPDEPSGTDRPDGTDGPGDPGDAVERSRAIALDYARRHGFDPESVDTLGGSPVLGPVPIDTVDGPGVAVRWIGSGRGGDYVQVEIVGAGAGAGDTGGAGGTGGAAGVVTVHGAIGDRGLPTERTED